MTKDKNISLRMAWIIPHIILVALDIILIVFVKVNYYELRKLPVGLEWWIPPYSGALPPFSEAHKWLILITALTAALTFGGYRIFCWIKDGKI